MGVKIKGLPAKTRRYTVRIFDWLGNRVEEVDGLDVCSSRKEAQRLADIVKSDHPSYIVYVEEIPLNQSHWG